MDGLRELLEDLKQRDLVRGHFRGLLNVLIGRRISRPSGLVVSTGITWRALAELFKRIRWDRSFVQELGLDPAALSPRDRERYWYQAITRAGVDTPEGVQQGEHFAALLRAAGYEVGPPPPQS